MSNATEDTDYEPLTAGDVAALQQRDYLLGLGVDPEDREACVDAMAEELTRQDWFVSSGEGFNESIAKHVAFAWHRAGIGVEDKYEVENLVTAIGEHAGRGEEELKVEAHHAAHDPTGIRARLAGGEVSVKATHVRAPSVNDAEARLNHRLLADGFTMPPSPLPIPEDAREHLGFVLEHFYSPEDCIHLCGAGLKWRDGMTMTVMDLLVDGPPAGQEMVYWVPNPVSPALAGCQGRVRASDVVQQRWLVMECDAGDVGDARTVARQMPALFALGLRPALVTDSGGKSTHFLFRLPAGVANGGVKALWTRAMEALAPFKMDRKTSSQPAQVTRTPGALRKDARKARGGACAQRVLYADPEAPPLTEEAIERAEGVLRRKLAASDLIWVKDVVIDPTAPPTDFVEGLLTRGSLAVVYGDSNVGKSFFMLDLCAHVATGKVWRTGCGDIITEPTPVLYIALEGMIGLSHRIHVLKERGILDPDAPFAIMHTPINLQDKASALDVLARAEAFKAKVGLPPGFIVVDTLSRAFGPGSENDSKDMTTAVRNIDVIKVKCPAAVAPIHHCGKDQAKGARGHSALRAATDTEIELFRNEGESVITAVVKKQRDLEPCAPMPFELESVPLYTNTRGRVVTSCVVRHLPSEEAGTPGAKEARVRRLRDEEEWKEYEGWLEFLPQPSQRQWVEAMGQSPGQATLSRRLKKYVSSGKARHKVEKDGSIVRLADVLPDLD